MIIIYFIYMTLILDSQREELPITIQMEFKVIVTGVEVEISDLIHHTLSVNNING